MFGKQRNNVIYEHFIYKTGYRYKGRSLGHSLDNDSKLISVIANYQDPNGWKYTAKYHHVRINVDGVGNHTVSVPTKNMDIFEASIQGDVGFGNIKVDLRHASDGIATLGHDGSSTSIGLNWELRY